MAEGFSAADEVVEGEVETGGQEHFYMETTCALAIPMKEDQEIKIFVPTQSPLMMQVGRLRESLVGLLYPPYEVRTGDTMV